MNKARNFKFLKEMDGKKYKQKMQKYIKMGHMGFTWTLFGILGPPNIIVTNKARNFKFGTDIDDSEY